MDDSELLLLSLPEELLEHIISRNSYDGISQCRLVCTSFEKIAQRLLNRGFYNVDKLHSVIQREVKAKLPRRESERRSHPLARHVDILAAIETRLSLLSMTFMKYIDMGLCCFIPGKVLDELFEVLTCVRKICNPPRAHEMLQELRDISSMAMEHFDEHIVPILKSRMPPAIGLPIPKFADSLLLEFEASMSVPPVPSRAHGLRHELQQLRHSQRADSASMVALRRELQECRGKMMVQAKKLFEQQKHLTEATCTIAELQKKQADEDEQISNLNRKVADYDAKFADIATRIDRICTVGPAEQLTALTMEPQTPQFSHLPSAVEARKSSSASKGTIGKSRKRQWPSDTDDEHQEGECDKNGADHVKDIKKLSGCKYTLRQRKTQHRQSNDNDIEDERAGNSRSQKRAKMSS